MLASRAGDVPVAHPSMHVVLKRVRLVNKSAETRYECVNNNVSLAFVSPRILAFSVVLVAVHAPLAAKVLVAHDANILESLQLATEGVEGRMT